MQKEAFSAHEVLTRAETGGFCSQQEENMEKGKRLKKSTVSKRRRSAATYRMEMSNIYLTSGSITIEIANKSM